MEIAGSNPAGGTTLIPVVPARVRRPVPVAARHRAPRPVARAAPGGLAYYPSVAPFEYLGVQIGTIVKDTVAVRCDGCLEVIDTTPWRMNILDVVAAETPVSWAERPPLNPGPFEFHPDPAHVRSWMRKRGYLFCRKGEVREIMRPVLVPTDPPRWALCDGIHRDEHELVPA